MANQPSSPIPQKYPSYTETCDGNRTVIGCLRCGKHFKYEYAFRGHYSRVHLGHKRYMCNVCDTGFWSKSDLDRHMPRHTGQRFICDICNGTYASKQRLTEHFRNPSGCWLDTSLLNYLRTVNNGTKTVP